MVKIINNYLILQISSENITRKRNGSFRMNTNSFYLVYDKIDLKMESLEKGKKDKPAHSTGLMPLLFVGHGSPMNAVEENQFSNGWKDISETIEKPEAVLCISAHWETRGTLLTSAADPATIHDFGGFPRRLCDVRYPAPGSPRLAENAASLVSNNAAGLDASRGLDHGCWSVLKWFYPDADVPVVQLSLDYTKDPASHYSLAGELASLRRKGVLIVGSGNIVHNLGMVAWERMNDPEYGFDWALEANEIIKRLILSDDHRSLTDYKSLGSSLGLAVPTPEHFIPLLYILALKEPGEEITFFNDKAVMGSLTMTSIKVG